MAVPVQIESVIFDLGGVLIDWNPEYLYSKIFQNEPDKMSWFLQQVCTQSWNMEQDAGRTFAEGSRLLIRQYPEFEKEILAFFDRWPEMLKSDIKDSVLILNKLKELSEVKLYALTNWSAETFPFAKQQYEFLKQFEGIVVSGEENTRKPFKKIYEILLNRYDLIPEKSLFIDDSLDNIKAANTLGINTLHFSDADQLKADLQALGLLPG